MQKVEQLTVKQFSELAGVSVQAVYQRINKDLSQYVHEFNGQKFIDTNALQLFHSDKSLMTEQVQALKEENKQLKAKVEQLQVEALQSSERESKLFMTLMGQAETLKQQGIALTQAQQLQAITAARVKELEEHTAPAPKKQRRSIWSKYKKQGEQ